MKLLTDTAKVYVDGSFQTFELYKAGSAERHATSDDITLKTALIKALNAPIAIQQNQGGGVFRVKINDGKGYLVYRKSVRNGVPTATIFHYHWNYKLDLPLSVPPERPALVENTQEGFDPGS